MQGTVGLRCGPPAPTRQGWGVRRRREPRLPSPQSRGCGSRGAAQHHPDLGAESGAVPLRSHTPCGPRRPRYGPRGRRSRRSEPAGGSLRPPLSGWRPRRSRHAGDAEIQARAGKGCDSTVRCDWTASSKVRTKSLLVTATSASKARVTKLWYTPVRRHGPVDGTPGAPLARQVGAADHRGVRIFGDCLARRSGVRTRPGAAGSGVVVSSGAG